MSDDNSYATPVSVCEKTGQAKDSFGGLLWWPDDEGNYGRVRYSIIEQQLLKAFQQGKAITGSNPLPELTCINSPYGHLYWAIGNEDDFVCFDYSIFATPAHGTWFYLDATVNSETGGFIQGFGDLLIPVDTDHPQQCFQEITNDVSGLIDQSLDWCCEAGDPVIEHDTKGWNQDPYFVLRSVAVDLKKILGREETPIDYEDYQAREKVMRFGSPELNDECGLEFLNKQETDPMEKLTEIKTKADIDTLLKSNVVTLAFQKKDGSRRVMAGTLHQTFLPPPAEPKPGAKPRKVNQEIVRLWSVADQGWRSFHPDQLLEILSAEPITEE